LFLVFTDWERSGRVTARAEHLGPLATATRSLRFRFRAGIIAEP